MENTKKKFLCSTVCGGWFGGSHFEFSHKEKQKISIGCFVSR